MKNEANMTTKLANTTDERTMTDEATMTGEANTTDLQQKHSYIYPGGLPIDIKFH